MIIRDDVISDVIRPKSTIREDHIDTPYSPVYGVSIWSSRIVDSGLMTSLIVIVLKYHPILTRIAAEEAF